MTIKFFFNRFIVVLIFALIGLSGLTAWLAYGNTLTPAKITVYRILPVPLALVGGQSVMMSDFLRRYELAKLFYLKGGKIDDSKLKNQISQSLIEQKKLDEIAANFGIKTNQNEISAEFERRKEFSLKEQNQSLESLLKASGIGDEDFEKIILKPDLLKVNLTIWFNGQKSLNGEALTKAAGIKKNLDNGAAMESLAKSESEDSAGKLLEGDLGFAQSSDILPELRGGLDSMVTGETKIFASRLGLHIIKLEEKDNKGKQNAARMHLRQIFIKPANFQIWYENQTKNIKVWNIINIH